MACMFKRPCPLNLAMAITPMDCGSSAPALHGAATPRQPQQQPRGCEKRSSPDNCHAGAFAAKEFDVQSPHAISPAADVFLRQPFAAAATPAAAAATQAPLRQQEMAPQHCTKRMRRGARRGVTFSGCCKSHDGLRPASRILDALVYGYFETQCISGAEDVRTLILEQFGRTGFATCDTLREVHSKLTTLCERVAALEDFCSMPVLIHGGGRGLQLQAVHRPHLRRLTKLFEQFVSGYSQ